MNDETTLLPCPFCGGEAHIANDYSSERDETRWNLWHECNGHEGESNGYGHSLHPWFDTPWYKTEAEAIAAWNTRTHGTLTAEQVREAVMSADRWKKPMGNTGLTNTHLIIRDDGWQAIADELNAALGSGECEAIHDRSYCKGIHGYCEGLKCSNCGEPLFSEFKSCPWCGMTIRKAVKQ